MEKLRIVAVMLMTFLASVITVFADVAGPDDEGTKGTILPILLVAVALIVIVLVLRAKKKKQ